MIFRPYVSIITPWRPVRDRYIRLNYQRADCHWFKLLSPYLLEES